MIIDNSILILVACGLCLLFLGVTAYMLGKHKSALDTIAANQHALLDGFRQQQTQINSLHAAVQTISQDVYEDDDGHYPDLDE